MQQYRTLKNNGDAITSYALALDNEEGSLYRKAMKMTENKDLNAAVYIWFMQLRSQGQPIIGPLICEKTFEINEKIDGNPDFEATTGWLMRFKSRLGIRHLEKCRTTATLKDTTLAKYWNKLLPLEESITASEELPNNQFVSELAELITKSSVFKECDQKDMQDWLECDVDDPGDRYLTDDEIIESVVDDQGSKDNEEELRDDDQVEKGPSIEEAFMALRRQ
ncbi:hypothetical protein LAZ67_13000278 [Cordylochernes scorpioides]|uniref:HTH CENPB-type domain-containing protein n=1 Tax=Cordylochernes scorpioides TaxID=51811 RepID=A0ABY6L6Q0_9ARAC|nr:hypothetical protein LAZ67_13000278 [Cordylochernes scorpioides]